MPLEWKTTEFNSPEGKVKGTHWAKHKPEQLLAALSMPPIKTSPEKSRPQFTVHKFGKYHLLARRFKSNVYGVRPAYLGGGTFQRYLPAEEVFGDLQVLVQKRKAILEMPVALIQQRGKDSILVTLWKKHDRTLDVFLSDHGVSLKRKEAAALKTVQQLAKLHAAGYLHKHPFARNFVVLKNGEVRLIDPSLLERYSGNEWLLESTDMRGSLVQPILGPSYGRDENKWLARLHRIGGALDSAYHDEFMRVKRQQKHV